MNEWMKGWTYTIRDDRVYDSENGKSLTSLEVVERLNKLDDALDDIARGASYPDMVADGALNGRITGLREDTVITFTDPGAIR